MVYNKKQIAEIKRCYKNYKLKQLNNIKSNIEDAIDYKETSKNDLELLKLINKEIQLRNTTINNKLNISQTAWEKRIAGMTQNEIDLEIAIENNKCYLSTLIKKTKTIAEFKQELINSNMFSIKESDIIKLDRINFNTAYVYINNIKSLRLEKVNNNYVVDNNIR